MSGPWEKFQKPTETGPWSKYAISPAAGLDYEKPIEQLRADIEALSPTDQDEAYKMYAKRYIQKERNAGLKPLPDAARGIPFIGGLLDEASAVAETIPNWVSRAVKTVQPGVPEIGRRYDENLAIQRERMRQSEDANPGLALGSQLAAGLATAGPAVRAAGQVAVAPVNAVLSRIGAPGRLAAPTITPARTTLGRVGQGVAIGAPTTAFEFAARGEGVENRLEEAGKGAVVGGLTGGLLPIGADMAARAYGAASDVVSPQITRLRFGPDAAADEILARRLDRAATSPAAVRLDLQRGQAQAARMDANSRATLPEAIADTSDDMRRLTGSVYRAGGESGNFVKETLDQRQRGAANAFAARADDTPLGQMERIEDATQRALLLRTANSARQTEQQIVNNQRTAGNQLYRQAYDNSEDFDISGVLSGMALRAMQYPDSVRGALNNSIRLFTQPSLPQFAARERALLNRLQTIDNNMPGLTPNQAARAAQLRTRVMDQLINLQDRQAAVQGQRFAVNNIERFDAAKKALDDLIDNAQRGGQNNLARELTQFKNELLDAVHANGRNEAYRTARNSWGSAAENREAIDLGRAALRENSEVSVEQFNALTEGQQRLFRLGFLESLRNAMGPNKPGTDVTQLFQQRRVQELMNAIIPRSQGRNAVFANRPERFGDYLNREQRMVQTRNTALGNSATAMRQQDDALFGGEAAGSMWNRFRASPSLFNVGMEAIGSGIQRFFGYRQDVAMALARRLLETDPERRNQILRRLQRRYGPDHFQRFADALDRTTALITAAGPAALSQQVGGARED